MKIRPVILSGGSGTRLWPVSRAKAPKQFVPLIGDESLFTATARSCSDRAIYAAPTIVGNAEHKFLIHDALEVSKVAQASVLLEPTGRNTAAAIFAAALAEKDNDILHLVRPSDHVISDAEAWHVALKQAAPAAAKGLIVLFGIKPDCPETGYGYIQAGSQSDFDNVFKISSFKEKPDEATARKLISSGALWNSGIFLFSPRILIEEAEKFAPEMLKNIRVALAQATSDARGLTLDSAAYNALPSEPFDRVIMEHTSRGAVVPCSMGWSDVGSWEAMWQASPKDAHGNVASGSVVVHETNGCLIRTEGPAVAILGMNDIAVVATKDAVLVMPRARTQDVKKLVNAVETTVPDLATEHARARRPWGTYESIARGSHFQVKHITVLPGRSMSLQMHHHRAEHWIVVAGTAQIECDDLKKLVFPNESVFIPKGAKHRLTNPGTIDLHLIEVQSGDYLGEDDIIRFDDAYGRVSKKSP